MKFFDSASTTKISENSLRAYNQASEEYFNPSALYLPSVEVMGQINSAREFFLNKFKAKQGSTFIFTGSATEANNAVLNSCLKRKDKKYIFSLGEHSSVYETAKFYKDNGFNVVFVPLKSNGSVDIDALTQELDDSVQLVSVIHVSNETGAINDIKKISELVKKVNKNAFVHADGVQAVGKLEIDLTNLGVDFYTISAHKIHGPKGIGGLFITEPNKFKPLIHGGGQEMSMRAGTENVPAIMAFKQAVEDVTIKDYSKLKHALVSNLDSSAGEFVLVSKENCVDNIISICYKNVRGESLQHMMELRGFLIGTGSACNSKAKQNRVLSNLVKKEFVSGAIRISFDEVSEEDCKQLALNLNECVREYLAKTK